MSLKSFVNTLQILKVLKLPKMLNIIAFKVLKKALNAQRIGQRSFQQSETHTVTLEYFNIKE